MGCFQCKVCNAPLSLFSKEPTEEVVERNPESTGFICNKCRHIEKEFDFLNDQLNESQTALRRIKEKTLKIIKDYYKDLLEKETIEIKSSEFKDLWNATENRWFDSDSYDKFLSETVVEGRLMCEAFSIFRSKSNRINSETLLGKLKNLKEACDNVVKHHEWEEDMFDLNPEDVIKQAKQE